jgi:hypothetical protein
MSDVAGSSKELSRCPHCGATAHGGTVHIEGSKFDRYVGASYVVCDHSLGGCGASGGFRDNQDEAIALWNRRAAHEPPAKPVAWRGVLDSAYELHPRYVYSDSQPERGKWEPLYAAPDASAQLPCSARLREALEIIAGLRQCADNTMGNKDVALAALRDCSSRDMALGRCKCLSSALTKGGE